jgi:hypothetical protein
MPGPWRCQGRINRSIGWQTKVSAPKCYEIRVGSALASASDRLRRRLELSGERKVVVSEIRHRRWRQVSFSVSSNGFRHRR